MLASISCVHALGDNVIPVDSSSTDTTRSSTGTADCSERKSSRNGTAMRLQYCTQAVAEQQHKLRKTRQLRQEE